MPFIRSARLLSVLLIASVAINIWQFFRVESADEGTARKPVAASLARNPSTTGPVSGKKSAIETNKEQDAGSSAKSAVATPSPEQQSEDELIYGASGAGGKTPHHGEPSGKISPQRLKELATMPVSQAERFRIQARLLLPGDRALDFGALDFAAGQRIKLERIQEFPYPSSVALARVQGTASPFAREKESSSPGQAAFSITPTTPADFVFKSRGLEIELDLTPAPGALVIGGSLRQTVFEGFGRMPGEAFSPIWQDKVIFTDNTFLQPQFTTRESPFVAAAAEGEPIRIPVLTSFGQTFLELTCTPVE